MASTPREGGGRPMTPGEGGAPSPALQLIVRQKGSAELRDVTSEETFAAAALPSFACDPDAVLAEYSPCSKLIACVHSETGVNIVSSETGALVCTFAKAKISQVSWSPQSSYLLTWGRWEKDAMNLLVWSVDAPGEPVAAFSQKQPPAPENWPSVQWTADEQIAAHIVTNEVHFYAGNNVGGERTTKLRLEGLKGFSLSPGEGPNYSLSIYRPEHKGLPAQIRLYHYPKLGEGEQVATKAFFNAESVDFKWEGRGRAVLVRSSTAVDKGSKGKFSGSSFYYGSSSLYYLTADGSFECAVPLEKEGPVQDVAWVPGNMQFVVLYGFMPAMGTMFDHKCKPLFNYGTGYRNTIKWSNSGRYVALCGFGNLPGDVEFWDRKKGAEGRVGLTKNDATCHSEWSPCSRYFLCGTTFPRLRVDNLYNIWNFDGSLQYNERIESELYQVGFRPGKATEFPRPPSPKKYLGEQAFAAAAPKAYVPGQGLASRTAVGGAGAGRSMVAGGAYKPPGSRGGSGGGGRSLAELSGETSSAGKASRRMQRGGPVGGFVEDEKPKSKNAAKNAKKKAKAAAAKRAAAEEAAAAGASGAREARAEKLQEPGDAPAATPGAAPVDPEKEAKKIQKKLRQIQQLEEKQAGGTKLEDTQLAKLATKSELEAQLAALGI